MGIIGGNKAVSTKIQEIQILLKKKESLYSILMGKIRMQTVGTASEIAKKYLTEISMILELRQNWWCMEKKCDLKRLLRPKNKSNNRNISRRRWRKPELPARKRRRQLKVVPKSAKRNAFGNAFLVGLKRITSWVFNSASPSPSHECIREKTSEELASGSWAIILFYSWVECRSGSNAGRKNRTRKASTISYVAVQCSTGFGSIDWGNWIGFWR